jgi:hypothetical protein
MPTSVRYPWLNLVGGVLTSLLMLGISAAPVASAPRLLWQTEPQGG